MKQIRVSGKCSGCGLCIVNSSYLREMDNGDAEPIPGKAIKESDLERIRKVVSQCPENALKIIEIGTKKVGREGAKEVINDLKKKCQDLSVKRIELSDIKLESRNYYIPRPSTDKEGLSKYSSYEAAKSAAKDEFNRLCYSEYAFRPMLKKVFVEYKVNVLKPFYTCKDEEGSAYYEYNQLVRNYLANAYAEICELIGEDKIPASWKNFSVYPPKEDWHINYLKNFDESSTKSGIIAALKNLSYTKADDYALEMDYDVSEQYVGEGLFGQSKYKKMWCFTGFYKAADRFREDLKWAIDYQSDEIEENAASSINLIFDTFEEELKKAFDEKIEKLEEYIK